MKKLSIIAFAVMVAVGCGKKDEGKSTSEKTTEMGKDTKPANPETATKPGDDTKTDTPAAPPVGALEEVKSVGADAPQECKDAEAAYRKIHGCDKIDPETKKTLVKSWNLAVTGSVDQLPRASADQKATIIGSCKRMVEVTAMLTKDCP